jgi:hypothetical protein
MAVLAEVAEHVRAARKKGSDPLIFGSGANLKVSDPKFQDGRRR